MASAKWVSHTFLAMLSLYTVGEHNETIMFSFQISDLKKGKNFGRSLEGKLAKMLQWFQAREWDG